MKSTRRKFIKAGLLSLAGFLLLDAFWLEHFFIEKKTIYLGQATDDQYDLKVVQISDLHLKSFNRQLKTLAKRINEEKPDLILFTGDSVDNQHNIGLLDELLSQLDHSIKKFAILGNWEYWGKVSLDELRSVYARHNCELLINNSRQWTLNEQTVTITGVDDFLGGDANIGLALQAYQQSDYHIILNHCPQYGDVIFDKLNGKVAYDLMLSGHTHGGQINLFGFIPFKPKGSGRYLKGWYPDKRIYVSKGIGTSILPIRFLSRAEFTVIKMMA